MIRSPRSHPPYPILFVTSNLGGGGAERALVNVINHLDRSLFRLHLALFQKEGVFLEELAPDVSLYEIQPGSQPFVKRNLTRFARLDELYRTLQPSLVMSIKWQANAVALLSTLGSRHPPFVINEQSAPAASLAADRRRRMLWPLARRIYRRADKVIVISQGIADELRRTSGIPDRKLCVIHNPIDLMQVKAQASRPRPDFRRPDVPAVVAAGRLTSLKNFPLLLRAARLVLQERPVDVFILGQGPEQAALEQEARSLGISDHVHLLGFRPNPHAYIAQADVFALTSNHEGFGNVLVEAMAGGVPVVATDCPYGPGEILAGGQYGKLVPVGDEAALARALSELLADGAERHRLGELGRERAQDFSVERIAPRYTELFLELIET